MDFENEMGAHQIAPVVFTLIHLLEPSLLSQWIFQMWVKDDMKTYSGRRLPNLSPLLPKEESNPLATTTN